MRFLAPLGMTSLIGVSLWRGLSEFTDNEWLASRAMIKYHQLSFRTQRGEESHYYFFYFFVVKKK